MSNFSVCPFCPSGSKDEMLFFTQSRRSKLMIIVVVPSEIKIEVFFIQRRPSKGCEIMQRFHGFTYWCWKLDKPVKVSRWLPSVWSVFEQLFATSSCTSVTDWFWWLVYRWSWSICANTRQEEQWSGGGRRGSCVFLVNHVARQQHTKPTSPSICHACKSVGSSLTRRGTMHMPSPQEHVQPSASTSDSDRKK